MRKKASAIMVSLVLLFVLFGCGSQDSLEEISTSDSIDNSEQRRQQEDLSIETADVEEMEKPMKIIIDGTEYEVKLDSNVTVTDILSHMPLNLELERYAEHEYYAELPFTPVFAEETTSEIKARHVYYWDGWNAFVINYIDWDIAPYQVVHIGEITDESISAYLESAEDTVQVQVE